jgi:hypothetical protein
MLRVFKALSSTYRVPGELNDNVCRHECLPRVRLRGALAGLVHCTLGSKDRHDLVDQLRENAEENEYAKHLVEQPALRVVSIQEGEANE